MSTRFHFHQVLMKVCNSDGQSVHFLLPKALVPVLNAPEVYKAISNQDIINSNQLSVHPS